MDKDRLFHRQMEQEEEILVELIKTGNEKIYLTKIQKIKQLKSRSMQDKYKTSHQPLKKIGLRVQFTN